LRNLSRIPSLPAPGAFRGDVAGQTGHERGEPHQIGQFGIVAFERDERVASTKNAVYSAKMGIASHVHDRLEINRATRDTAGMEPAHCHSSPPAAKEIIETLRLRTSDLAGRFSVRKIGLFGSCARAKARPGSDVDILVDMAEPTFDHYMDLKFFLEDLLHASVDLVLADTLKPRMRPYVMKEILYA
jgi:predicted nucleotidyltransferase